MVWEDGRHKDKNNKKDRNWRRTERARACVAGHGGTEMRVMHMNLS